MTDGKWQQVQPELHLHLLTKQIVKVVFSNTWSFRKTDLEKLTCKQLRRTFKTQGEKFKFSKTAERDEPYRV